MPEMFNGLGLVHDEDDYHQLKEVKKWINEIILYIRYIYILMVKLNVSQYNWKWLNSSLEPEIKLKNCHNLVKFYL